MASSRKINRKELKRPDEFVSAGQTAMEWVQAHARVVVAAVAGLFALGLVIVFVSWNADRTAQAGAAALGTALEIPARPVIAEGETPPEGVDKYFTSEDEQRQAFREALTEVRETHGGSRAAALAALHLGDLDYRDGRYDEAQADYEAFLKEAGRGHHLRFSALEGLAFVHEAKGDQEAALAAFERLTKEGNDFYKPFALVQQARLLAEMGRTDEARLRAQQVVEEYESSPAKARAEEILGSLPPAPSAETATAAAEG